MESLNIAPQDHKIIIRCQYCNKDIVVINGFIEIADCKTEVNNGSTGTADKSKE